MRNLAFLLQMRISCPCTWHILALSLLLLVGCSVSEPLGSANESGESDSAAQLAVPERDAAIGHVDATTIDRPIVEPVSEADYYVRNETSLVVSLSATSLSGEPVTLVRESVPPAGEALIYHAVEGTGGHVMPSNFFRAFLASQSGKPLYSGVLDTDWKEGPGRYTLTLHELVNYACEQAADCVIKDVHNCCGYFPRCVNQDSPTPAPECPAGQASVCGFPDITHCECEQNTCRSMQGDTEL